MTAWSVFGSYDWDSLVTRPAGHYESGAFDVRDDPPRPTAVADLIRDLATGGEPADPALATIGWWRRAERFLVDLDPRVGRPAACPSPAL